MKSFQLTFSLVRVKVGAIALLASAILLIFPHLANSQVTESASDDVPVEIITRAKAMAENSNLLQQSLTQSRTVFISVDVIREKGDFDSYGRALYQVLHYRYEDDTTIATLIDLTRDTVIQQIEEKHRPVALSTEEFNEAKQLALDDARIASALQPYQKHIRVEPLVVRTSAISDAWYGKRIVRLLFRKGADYLSQPIVFINLTDRKIIIEQNNHSPRGQQ